MSLARVWMRQLAGASAGALMAPAGLLLALAVLAAGGGLGGISAVGQLVSGPAAAPAGPAHGGAGAASLAPSTRLLVASLRSGTTRASVAGTVSPAGPEPGTRTSAHRIGPGRVTGHVPARRPSAPAVAPSRPAPVSTPPSAPAPPGAVDQVASTVSSLTAPLPDPVGSATRQAIGNVAATVDRVVPPHTVAGAVSTLTASR